jgi:hypothetical protein
LSPFTDSARIEPKPAHTLLNLSRSTCSCKCQRARHAQRRVLPPPPRTPAPLPCALLFLRECRAPLPLPHTLSRLSLQLQSADAPWPRRAPARARAAVVPATALTAEPSCAPPKLLKHALVLRCRLSSLGNRRLLLPTRPQPRPVVLSWPAGLGPPQAKLWASIGARHPPIAPPPPQVTGAPPPAVGTGRFVVLCFEEEDGPRASISRKGRVFL